MKTIDSTWTRNNLLDEINRLRCINEHLWEYLAKLQTEYPYVDRFAQATQPKFRVGQYVVALTNNPKWDSANGEPYRIDKGIVRITKITPTGQPFSEWETSKTASKFCYSHNGKEGDYSIPEVWFRALRPEEI